MRASRFLLLAVLQCSGLAYGQEQNCTGESELQNIYKTLAQNLAAFDVFLELLPVRHATCSNHLTQRWFPLNLGLSLGH